MSYWCQKYWEHEQKCELRSYLQKSNGEVLEAFFERVPRDLTGADYIAAIDNMKKICQKCKGQR